MAQERFIFNAEGETAPNTSAERRRAEENLARFLSDPENAAYRPTVHPAIPPTSNEAPRKARRWLGTLAQFIVFALLCAMVWLPTLYYITHAPEVFQTKWRIILPGEGVKSSIDLDSVGEAKTSEKSIFASRNFDPRSTYREIAGSNIVTKRAHAVAALGEDEEFDAPKIKVIPQTAILEFSLRRGDPQMAQDHATIFMQSFDARVSELRSTELSSRKNAALDNVRSLRAQLEDKQRAKLGIQREAGLVSLTEYKTIVANAGKRREALTDAEVELRDLLEKFRALADTLGVPPDIASQALVLKSDRLFQSLAAAYVEARTELATIDGNFGKNFPDRIMTAARRDEYEARLIQRIRELGAEPGSLSLMIDLTQSVERSELFATLVTMKAELAGRLAKVRELRAVVEASEARTLELAADADRVGIATQEADIANAILASSLANADLSQTNPYASYPLYQVLDEPKLPTRPISPKKLEAIAGATGATLLIITGFAALWYRRRVLRKRLKNA